MPDPIASLKEPVKTEAIPTASLAPRIVRFEELSAKDDEVWIEQAGQLYRLRRTKQGKLILTK